MLPNRSMRAEMTSSKETRTALRRRSESDREGVSRYPLIFGTISRLDCSQTETIDFTSVANALAASPICQDRLINLICVCRWNCCQALGVCLKMPRLTRVIFSLVQSRSGRSPSICQSDWQEAPIARDICLHCISEQPMWRPSKSMWADTENSNLPRVRDLPYLHPRTRRLPHPDRAKPQSLQ